MQNEVQFELSEGEEILAVGEKNLTLCICCTALYFVATIVFLYISLTVQTFYMRMLFGLGVIILIVIAVYLLNSYRHNQIYLTNKRFIITVNEKIEIIPYDEIYEYAWFDIVYLKSNRRFIFAYTNIDNVKEQFKEIYPQYKSMPIIAKLIIIAIFAGLCFLAAKIVPQRIYKLKQTYYLQKMHSQSSITNKDEYMKYLEKVLKIHWTPPKLDNDAKVTVEFQILPDGTMINEKVIETSGNRELDNSALFALRKAKPLKKLPKDLIEEKEVIINFTFDYDAKN